MCLKQAGALSRIVSARRPLGGEAKTDDNLLDTSRIEGHRPQIIIGKG